MKKINAFPYYRSICVMAACCLLLPPVVDSFRTGSFPDVDPLTAALLCSGALLLLLPVAEERSSVSFRFALAACLVCLLTAAAGLPARMRVLSGLLVPAACFAYRFLSRYAQLWPLFKPNRILSQLEWHARDFYMMALLLLAACFPDEAASAVWHWSFLLPCGLLYGLLVARVVSGRTLFVRRDKELELKELVKGNLRKMPAVKDEHPVETGRMQQLYDRVITHMEEKKPFLDEDFSMADLASSVYSNRAYLSKTINIMSGHNFAQFVNGYRIRYGVDLLRKDRSLRIIDVAMMSGFHTTVTFNMAFKLYMGETPTQFLQRKQAEDLSH